FTKQMPMSMRSLYGLKVYLVANMKKLLDTNLCRLFKLSVNLKNFTKLFVTVVCVSGFLYQTSLLFSQYISGKTIVSIRFGRLRDDSLPAFTICYPSYMSIDRVANMSDQFRHEFTKYEDIINSEANDDKKYNENIT